MQCRPRSGRTPKLFPAKHVNSHRTIRYKHIQLLV